MESLNILMIGGLAPWLPQAGGGQIIAYKLSKAIAQLGHNVDYIAIAPKNFRKEIEWGQIIYFDQIGFISKFIQYFNINNNYDIIHIHEGNETTGYGIGYYIHSFINEFRSKVCLGLYAPEVHRFPRSFNEVCWKLLCRKVDIVFSLSKFSRNNILWAYNIPMSKIRVTYAGVDNNFFLFKNKKENKSQISLLFCGRLNGPREQKGVDVLLRAMSIIFKENDNVVLNIVGTGPKEYKYKKLAKDLRIDKHTRFLGFVEHEKLPEYYASADLFVLPSRRESFGLVLAEAMAAGLPVVSTKVGAIPEVVEDGKTGVLVPPNNPEKFAEAVNYLLSNPKKMKKMGIKGHEHVKKNFTWDKVAKRVIRSYKEILN